MLFVLKNSEKGGFIFLFILVGNEVIETFPEEDKIK